MPKFRNLFFLIFSITLIISHVQTTFIKRYHSNLVLLGGTEIYVVSSDSPNVMFSNTESSMWKNLTALAIESHVGKAIMLCGVGHGAWLLYPGTDYSRKVNGIKYRVNLLIGDSCIDATKFLSVQSIGYINKENSGLITFKEDHFTSEGEVLEEDGSASDVKSLIYSGESAEAWTVEGSGKKICVYRPKDVLAPGICIISDFKTQLGIEGATIKKGCDESELQPRSYVDALHFQLQTCFGQYGVYDVRNDDFELPVISSVCADNADTASKLGFFKIVDAWKFRMNPHKQAEYNPAMIDTEWTDEETPMRMKMLSMFFAIFEKGCTQVEPEYFNLIRYIFMQHVKTGWKLNPQPVEKIEDKHGDWDRSFRFISECYTQRLGIQLLVLPEVGKCDVLPVGGDAGDAETEMVELFLYGEQARLDPVIEQVWLMLNYVSPYCSSIVGAYNDNIWVEFVNLFRRYFLFPLKKQWLKPGSWLTYYDYMFNGYSMEDVSRQVMSCAQVILRTSPPSNPIDRPFGLAKYWDKDMDPNIIFEDS